ncbi:Arginine kinase [Plakobranchus ocellatus]|uniref:Arginine kinase n=1 Tax=Plakobranchus ocellatus TaxID=259542 RepID=A0AAV4DML3_9GAST|nr:Arginine kinase [Plakobranchus ocellatus]
MADAQKLFDLLKADKECKSLLSKNLNDKVFGDLKEKKSKFGGTLADCIRSVRQTPEVSNAYHIPAALAVRPSIITANPADLHPPFHSLTQIYPALTYGPSMPFPLRKVAGASYSSSTCLHRILSCESPKYRTSSSFIILFWFTKAFKERQCFLVTMPMIQVKGLEL